MFLFPSEDVHARNQESFPINFKTSSVTIDDASHLAATLVQEIPVDSGNFPWYMTGSVAVLGDSYSEVVVNVIDLALNWQLFSDVGRPRSFVNFCVDVQCSKGREQNFQFWKLLAVVLDTNIKSVNKVHKRSDETLVMLPLI